MIYSSFENKCPDKHDKEVDNMPEHIDFHAFTKEAKPLLKFKDHFLYISICSQFPIQIGVKYICSDYHPTNHKLEDDDEGEQQMMNRSFPRDDPYFKQMMKIENKRLMGIERVKYKLYDKSFYNKSKFCKIT